MRAAHLSSEECPDVLIATESEVKERDWNIVKDFPRVYFIKADCSRELDLMKINVSAASEVIIFSNPEEWSQSDAETTMVDSKAV